jgi:hypothetical protein
MPLVSVTLHLLRHYQATLIWVFSLFRESSGCEMVIFCKVFSSILSKCPSHLSPATFITLTMSRSLYKPYISSRFGHPWINTTYQRLGSTDQITSPYVSTDRHRHSCNERATNDHWLTACCHALFTQYAAQLVISVPYFFTLISVLVSLLIPGLCWREQSPDSLAISPRARNAPVICRE